MNEIKLFYLGPIVKNNYLCIILHSFAASTVKTTFSAAAAATDTGDLVLITAELTEAEMEYMVACIKHIFPEHVVLQVNCTNTMNDQLLEDFRIQSPDVS